MPGISESQAVIRRLQLLRMAKAVGPGKCRITANCGKAKSVIEVEVERNYHIIALTGSMVFAMAMFALGFMLKTKRQK